MTSDESSEHPRRQPRYKRPFDLSILVGAHIVLAPLWIALWIAIPFVIWLQDHGPVFYRQQRVGLDGKHFQALKFRTMVPNADQIGPTWNVDNDSRVTPFGRLLRKTGLDELPQLIGILKGDMTFVGPRPLPIPLYERLANAIPGFEARNAVRPGLTGFSQVYNKTDESRKKFELDLEYVDRMSLGLDIKLVLLSVRNTLFARWDAREGEPP